MNKLITKPTSVALMLLLLLVGFLAVTNAQGRDIAAGAGEGNLVVSDIFCIQFPCVIANFGFAASSDPDGSNPKGHISVADEDYDVVCLNVAGNSAIIGGVSAEGKTVEIAVFDMRDAGTPDMFTAYTEVPPDCIGPISAFHLLRGNITVRNAE
ncbi:MAG TPA: hypothetical protein VJ691_16980 [Vicinamibacterales bacterium]|nr:hypothetical protein [Vicinamibacterales bacterium]